MEDRGNNSEYLAYSSNLQNTVTISSPYLSYSVSPLQWIILLVATDIKLLDLDLFYPAPQKKIYK